MFITTKVSFTTNTVITTKFPRITQQFATSALQTNALSNHKRLPLHVFNVKQTVGESKLGKQRQTYFFSDGIKWRAGKKTIDKHSLFAVEHVNI